MPSHINRPAVDNFGTNVRIRDYITPIIGADSQDEVDLAIEAFLDRWECSTSTFGGDTVTDCAEI